MKTRRKVVFGILAVVLLALSIGFTQIIKKIDLNIERKGHTATPLADGRILIAGGENLAGTVGAAEILDASSELPNVSVPLTVPRAYHAAAVLADGKVLLSGGKNSSTSLGSTEIFDPALQAFSEGPPMNISRYGHSATLLADGRVLVAGGDAEGTLEIYDPTTHIFNALATRLSVPRFFHSAALLIGGEVLIVGGTTADGTTLAMAEIFDPSDSTVAVTGNSMLEARKLPTLRLLPDGKVQVIGGNDGKTMEVYDPGWGLFMANASVLSGGNAAEQILNARTREALVHNQAQGDLSEAMYDLLDRTEHALTELTGGDRAILVGGLNSLGQILNSAYVLASSNASVTTNATDYIPGETVLISGAGWIPGETVSLTIYDLKLAEFTQYMVVADAGGNLAEGGFQMDAQNLGSTFLLTAAGLSSGFIAQTTFRDSPYIGYLTQVGPQSPYPVRAGGAATFPMRVGRGLYPSVAFSAVLTLLGPPQGPALPAGVGYSFNPPIVTFLPNQSYGDFILTLTTTAGTTPAGNFPFTVQAQKDGNPGDFANFQTVINIQPPSPAPVITSHPQNATVAVGRSVTFSVTATGTEPLTYQWWKGGAGPIPGATSRTYTIPAVSATDAGQYYVNVRNNYGSVFSNPAVLTVSALQPNIVWPPPEEIVYGTPLSEIQLNAWAEYGGFPVDGICIYEPTFGTILDAGPVHTLRVTFVPDDPATYASASGEVYISVSPAIPGINWSNPADITYGVPLGDMQLNAIAEYVMGPVEGGYSYDPPAGTVLNAGSGQTLSVAFYPASPNYQPASAQVMINVLKASPTIQWPAPADIWYGTSLDARQLNAQAQSMGNAVPGQYAYTPTYGSRLNAGPGQRLAVVFTPDDQANYEGASGSATINVLKARPVIRWGNPHDIYYGTPLGDDQLALEVVCNGERVPGDLVYTPPRGTVLNAGQGQPLSVVFTPADPANYEGASASVRINVLKAIPTINWPPPMDIVYGTPLDNTQLNATATHNENTVPGSFVYNPPAGSILDPPGLMLHVVFTPTDTANFENASSEVFIGVSPAVPEIRWGTPSDITYGTALNGGQLNATAWFNGQSILGDFIYNPPAGTVLPGGTGQVLRVDFISGDPVLYANGSGQTSINVLRALPEILWSDPFDIMYGIRLDDSHLNAVAKFNGVTVEGTFVYAPPGGTILPVGNQQILSVAFTPNETANFASRTFEVRINVIPAPIEIQWSNPADIIYGTRLDDTQLNALAISLGHPVTGQYNYSHPAGTLLNAGLGQPLSVEFIPENPENYVPSSLEVWINVLQAEPQIVWTNPPEITYGTPLGGSQLNAEAFHLANSVPGTFMYNPAAGTVLNAGPDQQLTVVFTPSDSANFKGGSGQAFIDVRKAATSIVWANPADISSGTALSAVQLNATASVPGTFVYTPEAGTVLGPGNAQPLSVVFTPADSTNYETANAVVYIDVLKKVEPVISWSNPAGIFYGTSLSGIQLNATVSYEGQEVPGTLAYTPPAGTCLEAGSGQALHVDFTPSDPNAYANASKDVSINILKAPLTVRAADTSKLYGAPLPAFSATYEGFVMNQGPGVLSGTLTFSTSANASSPAGTYSVTPSGLTSANYEIAYANGTLTIQPAPLTVKAENATKILGAPLPAFTASYEGFVLGEGPAVLGGSLAFQTPATQGSPVGTYPISPTGLSSNNYMIGYQDGILNIVYAPSGACGDGRMILQPINPDGTSVFKRGSTVPAKFRVFDANCASVGTPGVVSSFRLVQIISGTVTDVDEAVYSTTPDTEFRWSAGDQLWIFNISTKTLNANKTYVYHITLSDGSLIEFRFGLK